MVQDAVRTPLVRLKDWYTAMAATGFSRPFRIDAQPDDQTCGPTCLHALYRHYGLPDSLQQVIARTSFLPTGGTLAVTLGIDALQHGFGATLYSYNYQVFDPSWKHCSTAELLAKLQHQAKVKKSKKIKVATAQYRQYLQLGGRVEFSELTPQLLSKLLANANPIIAGVCATYLYQCQRELSNDDATTCYDDIAGSVAGHFVVVTRQYDTSGRLQIADPFFQNPLFQTHYYTVTFRRFLCALMLGVITYDANILSIHPQGFKT